jgi:glucokinase
LPKIGVIGIAGAVENNTVKVTNIPHWPTLDANSIKNNLKHFDTFDFINDFAAAGL